MTSGLDTGPTAKRLEALTDGVYAIAMTLLVLNIEIPNIHKNITSRLLYIQLLNQWPLFLHYVMSFVLLGAFWIIHHVQFNRIKRVNRPLLWINIFGLMFIALIPFSTSYIADYGDFTIATLVFHCNMLLIGLTFFINYVYATINHRMVDKDLDNKIIVEGRKRNLIIPVISLLAILVSFFSPRWSSMPYMFIPFILAKRYKHKH